jgi:Lon-like ATP-dependent protease
MTGELSVRGRVKPVGGIVCKVEAARQAGVKKALIPVDNWQKLFSGLEDIEVVAVSSLQEVLQHALCSMQKMPPAVSTCVFSATQLKV